MEIAFSHLGVTALYFQKKTDVNKKSGVGASVSYGHISSFFYLSSSERPSISFLM